MPNINVCHECLQPIPTQKQLPLTRVTTHRRCLPLNGSPNDVMLFAAMVNSYCSRFTPLVAGSHPLQRSVHRSRIPGYLFGGINNKHALADTVIHRYGADDVAEDGSFAGFGPTD